MRETINRHTLTFVLITMLIDTIGLGIIIPVMPALIRDLTGGDLAVAARYGGWLLFAYSLMLFLASPIAGNLSDAYGRRPVLIIALFALAVDYLIMAFAPDILWLFIGRVLAGIAGSTYSVAAACIADTSPPERRAQNFGLIGAVFGLGFIIGPVIGGLLGELGPRVPFQAAAGFAFLNALYGCFIFPETLKKELRRPFTIKRANPLGTLLQMSRLPLVRGLLIVSFLIELATHVYPSTWSYFTIEKFAWSEKEIGLSLGVVGVLIALVQGGLIRLVLPRFGARWTGYVSILLLAVSLAGTAWVTTPMALYLWLIPMALGNLVGPAVDGVLSNAVAANAQGELQGAVAAIGGIAAVISPLVMTQMFSHFTSDGTGLYFPGAPYLLAAGLVLMAWPPFWRSMRRAGSLIAVD